MITILVFYFVAVCSPDFHTGCVGWPRVQAWGDSRFTGWTDNGPWFTLEDCQAERLTFPYKDPVPEGPEGSMMKGNPWAVQGSSECYAREVQMIEN